jgi:hypothetical protein
MDGRKIAKYYEDESGNGLYALAILKMNIEFLSLFLVN